VRSMPISFSFSKFVSSLITPQKRGSSTEAALPGSRR
jgi:hypothetical protein